MNKILPECECTRASKSISKAFKRTWDMCRDALENIPEKHWRTGDIEYLIPARIMYHVLEAADFYSGPMSKGFIWGHRFNIGWEKAQPENLPGKESIREYLEEMIGKVDSWLQSTSDSDFLSAEKSFPWTGSVKLGRALYLLAHCHQHLGEINAELRTRGLPRIEWR